MHSRTPLVMTMSLLVLAGCVGVESSKTAVTEQVTVIAQEQAVDSASDLPIESEESATTEVMGPDASLFGGEIEPDVRAEDFEEGFCADDIYAKYLMARYAAENPNGSRPAPAIAQRTKGSKGGKGKKARRYRRENASYTHKLANFAGLAYAHQVMAGRAAPHFGALPIVTNDKVDFWVQYFKAGGRKVFMRWLVRGETLKRTVEPLLREGGVPLEFFYLAMVESGLSNKAYSRAAAAGTWQFMSGTAKLYGLKINHWVDERRDPLKSTVAAARYLKDLYFDLGDWHLAMAAYNAGPGKVRKAIRRNGSADFWQLCDTTDLAKETKEYVPKVLAAILLAADSQAHGFVVEPDLADAMPTTVVLIRKPLKLKQLAGVLGVPLSTLQRWNPELIRGVTPPLKNGYPLRLSERFAALFPSIEPKLAAVAYKDMQMHKVRPGDTLTRLARHYRVGVPDIIAVNPELVAARLKPGREIAIPISELAAAAAGQSQREVL